VKNRILLLLMALMLMTSLVIVGCAAPAPTPSPTPAPSPAPVEEEFEVKIASVIGPESPSSPYFFEWPAQWLEEDTNGRVTAEIYWGGSLAAWSDFYQATQDGIIDYTWVFAPPIPGAFPLTDMCVLPGLFPNQATSNVVMNELFRLYPQFEEQFSPKVKHITTQVHMRADLHSSIPIRSLDEIDGKVVACSSALVAAALTKLGAQASQMSGADMYTAMERGVIDAVVQAWGAFEAYHMYEVANYHTPLAISPGSSHWLWCRATWDKFTPEEQSKLELRAPWLQNAIVVGNVESSMFVRENLVTAEKGHEFIEWSKADMNEMRELFSPLWDEWAEEMEGMGYPGKDILRDAIRLIDGYVYG